jgi:hypothetical protein
MQRTVFLVHVSKGGMEETHASVSASTSHGITTVGSREEVQQLVNIRPCVGRTVVDGWRSLGWSWESLMARCGSGSVSVLRPAVSSGGRRALHSLSSNLQPLLLHVSEIERGSEKGAEHRVEDGPPQLYEGRLGFLLKYVPELNREVSKRSWTEDKGVLEREELWFETRQGLEQPWTRDTITHSFLFVLKGSRRAFFFPSSPDSPSAMQEDEERLFRDKPATRAEMSSRVVSVVISEGDVLYIPRYWWFKVCVETTRFILTDLGCDRPSPLSSRCTFTCYGGMTTTAPLYRFTSICSGCSRGSTRWRGRGRHSRGNVLSSNCSPRGS